jgi:hypothetical protein
LSGLVAYNLAEAHQKNLKSTLNYRFWAEKEALGLPTYNTFDVFNRLKQRRDNRAVKQLAPFYQDGFIAKFDSQGRPILEFRLDQQGQVTMPVIDSNSGKLVNKEFQTDRLPYLLHTPVCIRLLAVLMLLRNG